MAPLVAPELARPRERETRAVERSQAIVLLGLGGGLFEGGARLCEQRNDDEEQFMRGIAMRGIAMCWSFLRVVLLRAVACRGVARNAQRAALSSAGTARCDCCYA